MTLQIKDLSITMNTITNNYGGWLGISGHRTDVKATLHDDRIGKMTLEFTVEGGAYEAEAELRRLFPNSTVLAG